MPKVSKRISVKFVKNTRIRTVAMFALIVTMSGLAIYFQREASSLKSDPNRAVQEQVNALIADLGRHIILPEGEQPIIATVTDTDVLKAQEFFKNAKVGDRVFVYKEAKKAFLYDPAQDKVVNVSPVNFNSDQQGLQQTPPPDVETETEGNFEE